MKKLFCLFVVCLLSSCYSAVNRAWIEPHKEYSGYYLDYCESGKPRQAGATSLSPLLYAHGSDWYIAGIACRFNSEPTMIHSIRDGFYERRRLIPIKPERVRYHKITPELAQWLMVSDEYSYAWFNSATVQRELRKAGGEWLDKLPSGAVPKPAAFLKTSRLSLPLVDAESRHAPWYTYPAAGVTFVCIDIPFSAVAMLFYVFDKDTRRTMRPPHRYVESPMPFNEPLPTNE